MDNESQVIQQQMEDTRTSLQDKLESLEQHVTASVHSATEAVTDTVDSVKDAVQHTVDSVKDSLNLSRHVERHPWAMVLGAVVVGFVGARLLERALAPRPAVVVPPPAVPEPLSAVAHHSHPAAANGAVPPVSTRSMWKVLNEDYSEEMAKIKGLAVSAGGNFLREMLTSSATAPLAQHIREMVDGVTVKLGGHPIEGSLFNVLQGRSARAEKPKGAARVDLERMADDGCPHS